MATKAGAILYLYFIFMFFGSEKNVNAMEHSLIGHDKIYNIFKGKVQIGVFTQTYEGIEYRNAATNEVMMDIFCDQIELVQNIFTDQNGKFEQKMESQTVKLIQECKNVYIGFYTSKTTTTQPNCEIAPDGVDKIFAKIRTGSQLLINKIHSHGFILRKYYELINGTNLSSSSESCEKGENIFKILWDMEVVSINNSEQLEIADIQIFSVYFNRISGGFLERQMKKDENGGVEQNSSQTSSTGYGNLDDKPWSKIKSLPSPSSSKQNDEAKGCVEQSSSRAYSQTGVGALDDKRWSKIKSLPSPSSSKRNDEAKGCVEQSSSRAYSQTGDGALDNNRWSKIKSLPSPSSSKKKNDPTGDVKANAFRSSWETGYGTMGVTPWATTRLVPSSSLLKNDEYGVIDSSSSRAYPKTGNEKMKENQEFESLSLPSWTKHANSGVELSSSREYSQKDYEKMVPRSKTLSFPASSLSIYSNRHGRKIVPKYYKVFKGKVEIGKEYQNARQNQVMMNIFCDEKVLMVNFFTDENGRFERKMVLSIVEFIQKSQNVYVGFYIGRKQQNYDNASNVPYTSTLRVQKIFAKVQVPGLLFGREMRIDKIGTKKTSFSGNDEDVENNFKILFGMKAVTINNTESQIENNEKFLAYFGRIRKIYLKRQMQNDGGVEQSSSQICPLVGYGNMDVNAWFKTMPFPSSLSLLSSSSSLKPNDGDEANGDDEPSSSRAYSQTGNENMDGGSSWSITRSLPASSSSSKSKSTIVQRIIDTFTCKNAKKSIINSLVSKNSSKEVKPFMHTNFDELEDSD